MSSGTRRASGRLFKPGGLLFHKAKSPALFHSIESVDNLISIEDRDEPVHYLRTMNNTDQETVLRAMEDRGVSWA